MGQLKYLFAAYKVNDTKLLTETLIKDIFSQDFSVSVKNEIVANLLTYFDSGSFETISETKKASRVTEVGSFMWKNFSTELEL